MVAERPDAVPATSRTAVTSLEPNTEWPGTGASETRGATAITAEIPAVPVAPAYGVLLAGRLDLVSGLQAQAPGADVPAGDRLGARLARGDRRCRARRRALPPVLAGPDPPRRGPAGRASPAAAAVPAPPRSRPPVASSDKMVRDRHGLQLGHLLGARSALHADDQDDAALLRPGEVARKRDVAARQHARGRERPSGSRARAARPAVEAYAAGSSLSVSVDGKQVGDDRRSSTTPSPTGSTRQARERAGPQTAAGADRNIARQQRFWTRRAASWDHGAANNPGLVKVVQRVLARGGPVSSTRARSTSDADRDR